MTHVLPCMDRVFLAIIVSGLLLAAISTSLLVFSNGGGTTVSVNVPAQTAPEARPR
jgi:hypothetical protein